MFELHRKKKIPLSVVASITAYLVGMQLYSDDSYVKLLRHQVIVKHSRTKILTGEYGTLDSRMPNLTMNKNEEVLCGATEGRV